MLFFNRTMHISARQCLTEFCTHHNSMALLWRAQVVVVLTWPVCIPEMSMLTKCCNHLTVHEVKEMKEMNRETELLRSWIPVSSKKGPETGLFNSYMFWAKMMDSKQAPVLFMSAGIKLQMSILYFHSTTQISVVFYELFLLVARFE